MGLAGLLAGCGARAMPETAIGQWVACTPFGYERLLLGQDGTFEHEIFVRARNEHVTGRGTWKLSPDGGYVHLQGCLDWDAGFGEVKPNLKPDPAKHCALPIQRGWYFVGGWRIETAEEFSLRKGVTPCP